MQGDGQNRQSGKSSGIPCTSGQSLSSPVREPLRVTSFSIHSVRARGELQSKVLQRLSADCRKAREILLLGGGDLQGSLVRVSPNMALTTAHSPQEFLPCLCLSLPVREVVKDLLQETTAVNCCHFFFFFFWVEWNRACATALLQRWWSEDDLQDSVLFLHHIRSGIKLRSVLGSNSDCQALQQALIH